MKRKSKKTPKTKGERTPTESDKASSEGEPSTSKQIKTESFEPQEQVNNIDAETEASSNSNKSIESIKLEKIDDSQSLGSDVATEEKKSNSLSSESNSVCDMSSVEETFLFVELKLISIDQSCLEYKKLTQNFLCVNSNAQVDHLKKLIVKKMGFPEDLYDVSWWLLNLASWNLIIYCSFVLLDCPDV